MNLAYFENNVLNLSAIMIPPLLSSTMNGEDVLGKRNQDTTSKTQVSSEETKSVGRPEKADDQKSEKTIQNKESMN